MSPVVTLAVASFALLAVSLVLAVNRSLSSPGRVARFEEALAAISRSEFDDPTIDTALKAGEKQPRRSWNQYWYDTFSAAGLGTVQERPPAGLSGQDLTVWRDQQKAKPGGLMLAVTGLSLLFGLVAVGGPPGLFVPVAAVVLVRMFLAGQAGKRNAAIEKQLPLLLQGLSAQAAAGLPIIPSIQTVAPEIAAPLGDEIRLLAGDLSLGVDLRDALPRMAERVPSRELRFLAASMDIANGSGKDIGPQLRLIHEQVVQRTRIQQKLRAAIATAQPTAYLAYASVPAMFLYNIRTPEAKAFWFGSSFGFVMLAVVITLYTLTVVAIRLMIKNVEDT